MTQAFLLRTDAPRLTAVVAEREQGTNPAVLVDPSVQADAVRHEECLDAPTEIYGAGCGAVDLVHPSGDARENPGRGFVARPVPVAQVCVMDDPAKLRPLA